MRSDPFPARKSHPNERRVLFIGDSILNGGAQTDQTQLATELIGRRLRESLAVPIVVGNISAGSWGPENQLAYVRRFGFFQADVVVIVVSSHDAYDKMPDLSALPSEPQTLSGARLAVQEVVQRARESFMRPPAVPKDESPATLDACVGAFTQLIDAARAAGATVLVAQHLEAAERPGHELNGYAALRAAAEGRGVEPIRLGPAFEQARAAGTNAYRDHMHPNAAGQRLIADALYPAVLAALLANADAPGERVPTSPAAPTGRGSSPRGRARRRGPAGRLGGRLIARDGRGGSDVSHTPP